MDKMLTTNPYAEPTAEETINYQKSVAEMFAQMDQVDERIRSNQAEINRLKLETRAIIAELKAELKVA